MEGCSISWSSVSLSSSGKFGSGLAHGGRVRVPSRSICGCLDQIAFQADAGHIRDSHAPWNCLSLFLKIFCIEIYAIVLLSCFRILKAFSPPILAWTLLFNFCLICLSLMMKKNGSLFPFPNFFSLCCYNYDALLYIEFIHHFFLLLLFLITWDSIQLPIPCLYLEDLSLNFSNFCGSISKKFLFQLFLMDHLLSCKFSSFKISLFIC